MARRPQRSPEEIDRLIELALAGDRPSLARLLSEIERGAAAAERIDDALSRASRRAYTIGITGAPGAGKSTLLGALLGHVGDLGGRGAALVVDPSSPLSGGALLGDRLRMPSVATRKEIFVRSMASRGRAGGLADMTRRAARCLESCGWPHVFIETVGIGQVDVDVSTVADSVVVVLTPGAGDEVQMFKAGLMEIADIFVINKADHAAVNALRHDLAGMIASIPPGQRKPPVVETVATTGQGIAELWTAIRRELDEGERSGDLALRRERRVAREMLDIAAGVMARRLQEISTTAYFSDLKCRVSEGRESLHSAALQLLTAGTAIGTDQAPVAPSDPRVSPADRDCV